MVFSCSSHHLTYLPTITSKQQVLLAGRENMKQKITIKVQAKCDKCRSDALKVAAEECGVTRVELSGEDKVVVYGDGVDAPHLTKRLYKKIGYAWLISVEEAKPAKKEEEKKPPEVKKCASSCTCGQCLPTPCPPGCKCGRFQCKSIPCTSSCKCGRSQCDLLFAVGPDPCQTNNCIIM